MIRVAGPSDFVVVVSRLLVSQGDRVEAGDLLALTDTHDLQGARVAVLRSQVDTQRAAIARHEAELEDSRLEYERRERLSDGGVVAEAERDKARSRLKVAEAALAEARSRLETARAELAAAEAQLELTRIRAPRAGQVLQIHTRAGEKVGPEGVLDIGATDRMYAIAEVYETDAPRVRPGQRARILSPALDGDLEGTVERVGLQVGRLTTLGTDPNLKTDARIVEVEIRLDESRTAAALTNLEVEVLIGI